MINRKIIIAGKEREIIFNMDALKYLEDIGISVMEEDLFTNQKKMISNTYELLKAGLGHYSDDELIKAAGKLTFKQIRDLTLLPILFEDMGIDIKEVEDKLKEAEDTAKPLALLAVEPKNE